MLAPNDQVKFLVGANLLGNEYNSDSVMNNYDPQSFCDIMFFFLLFHVFYCLFSEDRFNLQIYKFSTTQSGRAVMLYVIKDGKKKVVCCTDKHEVHPVEMVSISNNICS